MKFDKCTQGVIFKSIIDHQDDFKEQSERFFSEIIHPIFVANNQKKLRLESCVQWDNRDLFIRSSNRRNLVLVDLFGDYHFDLKYSNSNQNDNLERLDITFLAREFIGGGSCYFQAFFYYLTTDLTSWCKYFWRTDLTSTFFESGISYGGFTSLNSFAFRNPYTETGMLNYSRSWIDVLRGEMDWIEQDTIGEIQSELNISNLFDIFSPGFKEYINSEHIDRARIPSSLRNDLDFAVWKTVISKTKITGKNFKYLTYADDYTVRGKFGNKMRDFITINQPKVSKTKYFWALL